MYVFDATPLIYLAKAERLDLIAELPGECCLPDRVYDEVVVAGIEGGHADARRIERIVEDGVLERHSAPNDETFERLCRNENLSTADAAVLALANDADGIAVMDEQPGRHAADADGITTRGTAYLVLKSLDDNVVSADKARETIDAMLAGGWHCSIELYTTILERIEELAEE